MSTPKIFTMPFARIYPLYITKAEKKGRTRDEVDQVITWLTGYDTQQLQAHIDQATDVASFFDEARMHPNASKITGVICGVRVEEIEDETMRNIRYLDKLIDELARGKSIEKILRT